MLFGSCDDGSEMPTGRHRIEAMDEWIVHEQVDSVAAATSGSVTVLRPGARPATGQLAIDMLLDSSTASPRRRLGVQELPQSVVEYGEVDDRDPPRLRYLRVWAVEDSEWRVAVDVVSVTAPQPPEGTEARRDADTVPADETAPPVAQPQFRASEGGALERPSVDEVVALLEEGEVYGNPLSLQAVRVAAEGCEDPDPWHRAVMAEVLATEPQSHDDEFLVHLASAVSRASRLGPARCDGLDVDGWLQRAIRVPIATPRMYQELLRRVNFWPWTAEVAEDPTVSPEIRGLAAEAVVYDQGGRLESHPSYLDGYFESFGLPDAYVRRWIPLLLALPDTREATALYLMRAVPGHADHDGAAALVHIIGSQVGAFPERFSPEATRVVGDAISELQSRSDLSPEMREALDRTISNRLEGRNYKGVVVQERPWNAELIPGDGHCEASLPEAFERAIREVVPGVSLVMTEPAFPSPCSNILTTGDFDGDGAEDLALQGTDSEGRVLVAVMNGETPEAHVLTRPSGIWTQIWTAPPDVKSPGCNDLLPIRDPFPEASIVVSYGEKYAVRYRFADGAFERVEGSGC